MPERSAVPSEFEREVLETLKRLERGVDLVRWRLGQFEETVGILDMKFEGLETLDNWMREIATAVGATRTPAPRS